MIDLFLVDLLEYFGGISNLVTAPRDSLTGEQFIALQKAPSRPNMVWVYFLQLAQVFLAREPGPSG